MTKTSGKAAVAEDSSPANAADDPILSDLAQAAADYQALRVQWERDRAELAAARSTAEKLQHTHDGLERRLADARKQLDRAQKQAEQQKARGDQFLAQLREIHRALFAGNIYDLILKACLALSGATRGMYITAHGPDDILRVRARVDIGQATDTLSPFMSALCRKALAEKKSLVCNQEGDVSGLPKPARASERFRNYLVAPVMLLHDLDGIVIVADKMRGEFDADDVASLLSVGDQASVAVENERLQRELQNAYLATVTMLADTMEAKDPYTHGHCEMVSRLARLTARRLGFNDLEQRIVCYTALLHDIGKIGVSDGILNKPGPLLPEEWDLMRAHVRIGYDLVTKLPALRAVGEAVLHHHERYDGSGYPDGLTGEAIPAAARIVTVVDAYCAMITLRSYKEAYTERQAREELRRCAGTQFDPRVVAAFLALLDSEETEDEDDGGCGILPGFDYSYNPTVGSALPPSPNAH